MPPPNGKKMLASDAVWRTSEIALKYKDAEKTHLQVAWL
jgi:hypothetical protein